MKMKAHSAINILTLKQMLSLILIFSPRVGNCSLYLRKALFYNWTQGFDRTRNLEPEHSLPCSQEPAIERCPEPREDNPPSQQAGLNIILRSTPSSLKLYLTSGPPWSSRLPQKCDTVGRREMMPLSTE
jgi:hypothetical protein